jgi:hypothetical protein
MPGLVPGIHVFLQPSKQVVDGRDISAFTRVFDALCPAMTQSFPASEFYCTTSANRRLMRVLSASM